MLLYTLEVHAECATLYLRDLPRATDLAAARAICGRLPASVRVLRVDLHAVAGISDFVRENILALVRDWRHERLGYVTVAGSRENCEPIVAGRSTFQAPGVPPTDAALTATFL